VVPLLASKPGAWVPYSLRNCQGECRGNDLIIPFFIFDKILLDYCSSNTTQRKTMPHAFHHS
jgi:hypothetical protein